MNEESRKAMDALRKTAIWQREEKSLLDMSSEECSNAWREIALAHEEQKKLGSINRDNYNIPM